VSLFYKIIEWKLTKTPI